MGDAWDEFRQEVFGEPYMVWHEGADIGALIAEHEHKPEMWCSWSSPANSSKRSSIATTRRTGTSR